MTLAEINARKAECEAYGCPHRSILNYYEPSISCPAGHWGPTGSAGLAVSKIAKPIAKTADRLLGTNLQNCGGCIQMETDLNAGIGFAAAAKKRFKNRRTRPR